MTHTYMDMGQMTRKVDVLLRTLIRALNYPLASTWYFHRQIRVLWPTICTHAYIYIYMYTNMLYMYSIDYRRT